MKKHLCIMRTADGLKEVFVFSELSGRELKKSDETIVTVLASERVAHPSPEILVKALKLNGVDVAKVYATCFELTATIFNSDNK